MRRRTTTDPDIARVAALIGDASRAAILSSLADRTARPAGELARLAGVSAPTASAHLEKLTAAHLVAFDVQGRYRYYRLHNPHVADLLESLAVLAPPAPALTPWQHARAQALRFARTCYGHLAGRLGVALTDALLAKRLLAASDGSFATTAAGVSWFGELGIDVSALRRRPLAKRCLDWSERRPHLAGAIGVAFADRLFELSWIARARESRVVRLTDRGRRALEAELGIALACRGATE